MSTAHQIKPQSASALSPDLAVSVPAEICANLNKSPPKIVFCIEDQSRNTEYNFHVSPQIDLSTIPGVEPLRVSGRPEGPLLSASKECPLGGALLIIR